jgi:predicted RNase H-like nuclease (RuvC/YqgF family)
MADEIEKAAAILGHARERFENAESNLKSAITQLKKIVDKLKAVAESKPDQSEPDTSAIGTVPSRDSLLALQKEFLSARAEFNDLTRKLQRG